MSITDGVKAAGGKGGEKPKEVAKPEAQQEAGKPEVEQSTKEGEGIQVITKKWKSFKIMMGTLTVKGSKIPASPGEIIKENQLNSPYEDLVKKGFIKEIK